VFVDEDQVVGAKAYYHVIVTRIGDYLRLDLYEIMLDQYDNDTLTILGAKKLNGRGGRS
jgi:hypothetical protein